MQISFMPSPPPCSLPVTLVSFSFALTTNAANWYQKYTQTFSFAAAAVACLLIIIIMNKRESLLAIATMINTGGRRKKKANEIESTTNY
jgi:hypothetical protein